MPSYVQIGSGTGLAVSFRRLARAVTEPERGCPGDKSFPQAICRGRVGVTKSEQAKAVRKAKAKGAVGTEGIGCFGGIEGCILGGIVGRTIYCAR